MQIIIEAVAPTAATAAVFGAVVLWDRLREPHRDLRRPFAVVDMRTFRDAERRVGRLLATGELRDQFTARHGVTAMCKWLRDEVRFSRRPARRVALASKLERWEARKQELLTLLGGADFDWMKEP